MNLSTASERLIGGLTAAWTALRELGPLEASINIGLSALVLIAAYAAGRLVQYLLHRGARALPGPADAEKHVRTRRVARFTWTVFEGALVLAAVFGVAAVWGFDLMGWLSRGLGEQLVRSTIRITVLVVLTFAALELAGLLVARVMARISPDPADIRRSAQLATLAPLLRGVAQGAILVLAALMILGEIGVKIGPLLAGAGVIGIAIGFGAQTLVKDFLTGTFLIAEDIVAVGDIVTINSFGGVVEEMTLRTIRLRDLDGTLHVFPYSEAQVIHNMTKTFSFYVFDLMISYESDIDRAFELMREVGAQMQADPEFADRIIEPFEILGVNELGDSGVVLKGRLKTRPGAQWGVGREYNRRIKLAFDAGGIEIPYPHMKLVTPQPPAAA